MVRHKQRYMVIEINSPQQRKDDSLVIPSSALYRALSKKVQQLHGDFGSAAIREGFVAKYFNEKTRIAIVRSRHGPHKLITTVLPFVTEIDKKQEEDRRAMCKSAK
uniref:Ribonuclease P/MRP protein subunit POP5 n=1 Tax=Photinus pyralis TaxID=7054 RepID=A0A1Y1LCT6_PHOPY